MKAVLFSVVMPVFNAEARLSKSINSILLQRYEHFELIIIDDGSTDDSGQICQEFAAQDQRVRYTRKVNGGVSEARNAGLLQAEGSWILFVDSDDELAPSYLENYYTLLNPGATDADQDWILSGASLISEGEMKPFINYEDAQFSIQSYLDRYNVIPNLGMVWGKLYSKNILETHDIRFDQGLSWGEDTLFNLTYIKFVAHIRTVSGFGYRYFDNEMGLSRQNFSYAYYLNLLIVMHRVLQSLPFHIAIYNNLHQFFSPLFHSIYKMDRNKSFRFNLIEHNQKFSALYASGFEELIQQYFKNLPGFKGRFAYLLLRFKFLNLFNLYYSFLSLRWS